jgi:hypothetical protein
MPGRAFQQAQTAVGFVNGMLRNPVDLYLCMSLQSQSWPPRIKNGREQRGAMRRALNAVALRCFYLDVDIKGGKFRDTTHALTVFGEWRRKIGLPLPSLLVFSGSGGFHVYWILHEPIPLATWQPVAEALKEACQQGGFEADHKVTANAALILRIPGTFNQKHQPPRLAQIAHEGPDYALADIETPLAPYKITLRPGVTQPPPVKVPGNISPVFAGVLPTGRLDAGLDSYVPTIEEVAAICPFIRDTMADHGRMNGEQAWRESLRVAAFVQDGPEVAHELSDGHISYAEQDTDAKYAEVEANKQRVGWPQCRAIRDAMAAQCKTCPHLQQDRSPLNFAKPAVIAAASIAAGISIAIAFSSGAVAGGPEWLPFPYQHDKDKRVYMDVPIKGDDSKTEPEYVLPLPIRNLALYKPGVSGGKHLLGFDVEVRNDIVPKVAASFQQIMDTRKFSEHLGDVGLLAKPVHIHRMRDFMTAFVHQLRDAKNRITVYNNAPFGWFEQDSRIEGFVYARQLHNSKAPLPIHPLSSRVDVDYTPTGDLTKWKDVAKLITDQKRPELIAPICASIGSPLMKFQNLSGSMHMHGESGSGKSYSLKLAQTIWGHLRWMAQLQDTTTSIDVLLSQLHHLPAVYDEVLKGSDRKLVDLFLRLGQGNSKKRSRRDGQDLGDMHDWNTILLSAANLSMQPYIAEFDPTHTAAGNRVFEYLVLRNTSGTGLLDTGSEAERIFGMLHNNYGVAGIEIAKFYGTNYDVAQKLVATLTDAAFKRAQCTTEDRFRAAITGATLSGGLIGQKLGLLDFDMDQLEGFMIEQLQEQRLQRKAAPNNLNERENVERLIAEYIAANRGRVLVTEEVWTGAGRSPKGWQAKPRNILDMKGQQIDVRVGLNQKIIRVSQPAFHAWLRKERGMSFSDLKRPILTLLPNTRISRWDLGHGVPTFEGTRIWVLEIVDPPFWDFN